METLPTQDVELYETDNGEVTLRYREILLHDLDGPMQESTRIVEKNCIPTPDRVHLILGLGLGYTVDAAYKYSEGRIFVYEPDLAFMRFVLENVDLSEFLGSGRVWLLDQEFDIYEQMRPKVTWADQLDVVALHSYAYLMAEEITEIMAKLTDLMRNRVRDYQTCRYFHYKWITQVFENSRFIPEVSSIDKQARNFKNKPAIVISRGPSLDTAIEDLKALKDSAVLIAVGGALRHLWKAGITPDLAMFYDANGMQQQLNGIPKEYLADITFLLSPFTQPCCFEEKTRGKYIFFGENNPQIASWFDRVLGRNHKRIAGGMSVSIIGFQMALFMECSPIILVGQDLSFPNNQVYAGGIEIKKDEKGRLNLDNTDTMYARPQTMFEVRGQNGEMLPTFEAFSDIVSCFEDAAFRLRRDGVPVELYNASIGGAKIDGYELKPLAEFRDQLEPWKHALGGFALEDPTVPQDALHARRKALQKGVSSFDKALRRSIRTCEDMMHMLPEAPEHDPSPEEQKELTLAIERCNDNFLVFMRENPFVAYMLVLEILRYRRSFSEYAGAGKVVGQGLFVCRMLLGNTIQILQGVVLPLVEKAAHELEDGQYQTRALTTASSS